MVLDDLREIYKKEKLFVNYHSSAESDINRLSLLLQKYEESDDYSKLNMIYSLSRLKSQVADTAWVLTA